MQRRERPLLLILARRFAEETAMPVLVTDSEGTLVFFNEPAEAILGQTWAEAGEMKVNEWTPRIGLKRLDGTPITTVDFPGGVALLQQRPSHDSFRLTALDGVERVVSATAFPLFTWPKEFVGVLGIFWEAEEGGT